MVIRVSKTPFHVADINFPAVTICPDVVVPAKVSKVIANIERKPKKY